jgi:hypothetical protein
VGKRNNRSRSVGIEILSFIEKANLDCLFVIVSQFAGGAVRTKICYVAKREEVELQVYDRYQI